VGELLYSRRRQLRGVCAEYGYRERLQHVFNVSSYDVAVIAVGVGVNFRCNECGDAFADGG